MQLEPAAHNRGVVHQIIQDAEHKSCVLAHCLAADALLKLVLFRGDLLQHLADRHLQIVADTLDYAQAGESGGSGCVGGGRGGRNIMEGYKQRRGAVPGKVGDVHVEVSNFIGVGEIKVANVVGVTKTGRVVEVI